VSFALSAGLIARFVSARAGHPAGEHESGRTSLRRAFGSIIGSPLLRSLLGLGWLAGFYIVPEAVAAPYAKSLGSGAVGVGLLMASMPCGGAVGAWLLVRFVPTAKRGRVVVPLAVAAGLPLAACWASPGLGLSMLLWAFSGAASAYQVFAAPMFVEATPAAQRARAVGLAASGLVAVQGLGALAGGWAGDYLGIGTVVALAGLVGAASAIGIGILARRSRLFTRPASSPEQQDLPLAS
jgi:predicted MFS family arabinose efflux permease